MATASIEIGFISASHYGYAGKGYLAGEAPPDPNPDDLDGRAKVSNAPGRVQICVYERSTMICVASTFSADDGTWRVEYLNPDIYYTVIGFDRLGTVNAAIQDWVKPALMDE